MTLGDVTCRFCVRSPDGNKISICDSCVKKFQQEVLEHFAEQVAKQAFEKVLEMFHDGKAITESSQHAGPVSKE